MNVGSSSSSGSDRGTAARILTIALGVWLFVSAFLWPHASSQGTNTWILGVIAALFGFLAMFVVAGARYVVTVVAVWLFISAFGIPSTGTGTVWNNVLVALGLFVCSLVPGGRRTSGIGSGRAAMT